MPKRQEIVCDMHVHITPAMRTLIERRARRNGSEMSETIRRLLEYAITHASQDDWTTPLNESPNRRIPIKINGTTRLKIDKLQTRMGITLKEFTARALYFALRTMTNAELLSAPIFCALERRAGRPRKLPLLASS